MDLSDDEIQGLIDAWKSDFNETLTFEQAHAELARLLDSFLTLSEALSQLEKE